MKKPAGIGIIGVGDISGIYLKNIHERFPDLKVVGVCDLVRSKAEKAQEQYPDIKIYETDAELVADPEVELVLNLTRPREHFDVSKLALEAGKHVYTEKPLAVTWELGEQLNKLADSKGLTIGGAPDTFLGAGIQSCRTYIDEGLIGDVVGARCAMICRGHEGWHPDPNFYYEVGGGPLLDMGPYYVTALVNLMGPVRSVTARAQKAFPTRLITSQPKSGEVVPVESDTTIHAILEFESGVLASLFVTFDVVYAEQAHFEIYGSEGTLRVPDPNTFGGPIEVLKLGEDTYEELEVLPGYAENSRGLGLNDMVEALREGRTARAGQPQVLHALEIMTAIQRSADILETVELTSEFERQPPL